MENSLNIFQAKSNFLNKRTTQYSLAHWLGFKFGMVDLDPATNAPGIGSKRKTAVFPNGGFLLFGFGNINFGNAVGFEKVLGTGGSNWSYHDVLWQRLVVGLNSIKF